MKLNSFQQSLHDTALKLSEQFSKTESELIEILSKIDEARVFLVLGYSSLYTYAHECLRLSEANAYAFTSVARKSKQIPELKAEIQSGNLSVAKARRILSVITPANKVEWISKAVSLPKTELEREVIKANPEAEKRESIRAISEDRFSLKLGISEALVKKLRRAQIVLMNKGRKNLSLEQTLEMLTDEFLAKQDPVLKAKRIAESKSQASDKKPSLQAPEFCPGKIVDKEIDEKDQSEVVKTLNDPIKGVFKGFHPGIRNRRPLSSRVKREVLNRDEGQCQFQGSKYQKCGGMAYVEIHHKQPVSKGGRNTADNLITLCSKHHKYRHEAR